MLKRFLALLLCLFAVMGCAHAERLPDDQLITYYDNAVFVGDSLFELLRYHINGVVRKEHPQYFQGVKFYSAHGFKLATAAMTYPSHTEANLMYKGRAATVQDIMRLTQPDKVFFQVGMNDRIGNDVEAGLLYVETLNALIHEVSPNTKIHYFSLTPVTAPINIKEPNRQIKRDGYNAALEEKCRQLGVHYIEVAAFLKDAEGLLDPKLATDDGYHLNDKGNTIWIQKMLDFAQTQYEAGQWAPAPANP